VFHKSHFSFSIFQTAAGGRNRRDVKKLDICGSLSPVSANYFSTNGNCGAAVFPQKAVMSGKKM